MVETVEGGRGTTPTISKGIKRRDLRYNANGAYDDPTTINKRNGGRKLGFRGSLTEYEQDARRVIEAEVETLRHYFDDDWFDDDSNKRYSDGQRIRFEGTPNKPFRCVGCNKAFHRHYNKQLPGLYEVLPSSVFSGVRLKEGECDKCKSCDG